MKFLQNKKTKSFKILLMAALIAMSGSAFAQVKIGTNPTVIGTNSNLEVEATSGNKTVVQKDNGNVGIGTGTPGNKLEINSGTTNTSGLRFTNLNNASGVTTTTNYQSLGVNASGDVVTVPTLLRGNFVAGDVSAPATGSRAVTGFITSANVASGTNGAGVNLYK